MPDDDPRWRDLLTLTSEAPDQPATLALARALPLGPIRGDGGTVLHIAAAAGAEAVALDALARGADPLARTDDGWTPLRNACLSGSDALVRALLDRGALADGDAALEAAISGMYLHKSVASDHSRGVRTLVALLAAGVSPAAVGPAHQTSAARRAGSGLLGKIPGPVHVSVIDAFLAAGATLRASGETALFDHPLAEAAAFEDGIVLEALFSRGAPTDGRGALHGLARRGASELELDRWLSRGVHIDARDQHGLTPLLEAASWGREACCNALIARGADVLAVDDEGHTALDLAARRDDTERLQASLAARGVQRKAPPPASRRPASPVVPPDARRVRVIRGMFAGCDAHVTDRGDGRLDAVVSMFGQNLAAVLDPGDLAS